MAIKVIHEPEPKPGTLGTKELYALAVGQVIGAGVITLIVPAIKMTGYSAWLAYFTAILMGFIMVLPTFFVSSTLRLGGGNYSMLCDLAGPKVAGIFAYAYLTQCLSLSLFGTSAAAYLGDIFPILSSHWARVAVGAAQVIGGRHGLEAGDGGVYFLGGFLAEGVAGLDGGVPDGGHLGHVLQGRLTEIVVPGELGRLLLVRGLEALGNLEAEHGEEARLHGLLVEVGAGVEPEEGGVGAVLVGEVVVRGGVVVLILGVRELVVAHGDRSRAGVQQVGVEKHDDDDE